MRPHLRLTVIFLVTAALGAAINHRFHVGGDWLPPIPTVIGDWSGRDRPLSERTAAMLGHPKYVARDYESLFGERVHVSVIAAGSPDAYHEPTICSAGSGFRLTAERLLPLGDAPGGVARAMVLRGGDTRVLMYYWLQNRDGRTDTRGPSYAFHDLGARLSAARTAFRTAATGQQTCIVRVFAVVPKDDAAGAQTRRNVEQVSRAVQAALHHGSSLP